VLRKAVRRGRRLRGRLQLTRTHVTGDAPQAVVAALKAATAGTLSADERRWVDQIEAKRVELRGSTQPLTLVDFGAGPGNTLEGEAKPAKPPVLNRTLGQMTTSSKPPQWAYLLFRLVRELKPKACLEMGACVGISASYQAAALKLNGGGRLLTLEGSELLAERSATTLEEMGLADFGAVKLGPFSETIDASIKELQPVDWAFIDGHHVEAATIEYMEKLTAAAAPNAVLVFDDINWSPGMQRAWRQIVDDPRFSLTVDLRTIGLAVVSSGATKKQALTVSYG
jgi:predicted O-methyltransferase YrrM